MQCRRKPVPSIYSSFWRRWNGKAFCMWNELRRFCRISRSRKWLLWEALIALAIARIAMALLPFRRIAAWIGTPGAETPATATVAEICIAEEIGWAVGVLARRVPWDGRCLVQALAGIGM